MYYESTYYYENYLRSFHKASHVCLQNATNIVWNRYDNFNLEGLPELRPWTFHKKTYTITDADTMKILPTCMDILSLELMEILL